MFLIRISPSVIPGSDFIFPLDARVLVSTDGGWEPVWSPLGDTLYYRTGRHLMAVPITTTPTFSADRPKALFDDTYWRRGASGDGCDYDVTPDGERFVMIRQYAQVGGAEIHIVLDWFTELRARDPHGED